MQGSTIKHIIALLLVLAVVGGLYYASTSVELFSNATTRAAEIEAETAGIEQEIREQLDEINSIRLDTSVFQSDVFTSLEDRSVTLEKPETTRSNPFAPF